MVSKDEIVETDAGPVNAGKKSMCWWCLRSKTEIEKLGEPMVERKQ